MRNIASIAVTNTQTASTTAIVTVAGTTGKAYQITGFDGASSDQPFQVELQFGTTPKLRMQGSADTTVGRDFGDNGPVSTDGQSIRVITTPAASGNCTANLIYKIIF